MLYMYTDIIDKYDNNTWRTIYEAIDKIYFEKSKMFTGDLIERCKINTNVTQNIPNEIRNSI